MESVTIKNGESLKGEAPAAIVQSLFGFEFILTCAADGADEIFGEVFEGGAGGDAVIGVANGRIIFPTTNVAYVLAHSILLVLIYGDHP